MATMAPEARREVRPHGLAGREAERRLVAYGRNELARKGGRNWPRELAKQVTHPLALLLWMASALAFVAGTPVLAAAIVAVIVLNAVFAFAQERQAERSIEALHSPGPISVRKARGGLSAPDRAPAPALASRSLRSLPLAVTRFRSAAWPALPDYVNHPRIPQRRDQE